MKHFFLSLLLAVSCFCVSCGSSEEKDVQAYLDEITRLYQEAGGDTKAVDAVWAKGLAAYPDSIPLLQSRANMVCSRGMLAECRADSQRLLKLKPDMIEFRMMLCLLDDYERVCGQSCQPCYQKVADMYAARAATLPPERAVMDKANRVAALLLAGLPEAQAEKSAFLASLPESEAKMQREILDYISRERILSDMFRR